MDLTGVRWDAVTEISLRTTSLGPAEEDVFFVFTYDDVRCAQNVPRLVPPPKRACRIARRRS